MGKAAERGCAFKRKKPITIAKSHLDSFSSFGFLEKLGKIDSAKLSIMKNFQ